MSYKAVMTISKIKNVKALQQRYDHDYRIRNVRNADESIQNDYVKKCDGTYAEEFKKRINNLDYYKTHSIRKNGVLAYDVLLTYSHGAEDGLDMNVEEWEQANLKWLQETFQPKGVDKYSDNIISVVCHRDESTPHIHAVVIPIDPNGKLNSSHYIKNKFTLQYMQDTYAKSMSQFGLDRGTEYTNVDHKLIRQMYTEVAKTVEEIEPLTIEDNETIQQFEERVHESRIAEHLVHLREMNELKNTLANERSNTEKDLQIQKLTNENKYLNHESQEMVRELGSWEEAKRACKIMSDLRKAKDIYPDKSFYKSTIEAITKIVSYYGKQRKKDRKHDKGLDEKDISEITKR